MHRRDDARDYHKYIEKDRALVRRFQAIKIVPPTEEETLSILGGVKERYERFHGVSYADEALRASVYQSNRVHHRPVPPRQGDRRDRRGRGVESSSRKRTAFRR